MRLNRLSLLFALAAVAALARPAAAEGFDKLASGAERLRGPRDLARLVWSRTATCSFENDFMRRQCEAIRALSARRADGSFLISEPGALSIGDFDDKKKSVEIRIAGCAACGTGIELGGGHHQLIGAGQPELVGGVARGEPAYLTARRFSSADEARTWVSEVGPRLVTELVIRIPKKIDSWSAGEEKGYRVSIVGVRVYDPCDGSIVAAKPAAKALGGDPSKCGEPKAEKPEVEETEPEVTKPAAPALPERLSPADINNSLRQARKAAQDCFETYGVEGTAKFRISISGGGEVLAIEQLGDFVGTPTGDCVEKAVKATTFPKSQKKRTTITYPIMVR